MPGAGVISTLSTTAQSMAWQHSSGYQSCAAAGVAVSTSTARNPFFDILDPRVSCGLCLPPRVISALGLSTRAHAVPAAHPHETPLANASFANGVPQLLQLGC